MPAQHFTPKLFAFLRELAAHNDRNWFAANKERYERDVRTPALQFINDFAAPLAKFAPHLAADPRPVGGSMFPRGSRAQGAGRSWLHRENTTCALRPVPCALNGDAEWKALRKSKLPIEGGSLKRPPRGFDPSHPFIDDLKRTDFVTSLRLADKDICKPGFVTDFAKTCKTMAPLVRFVAHSLDLPW